MKGLLSEADQHIYIINMYASEAILMLMASSI